MPSDSTVRALEREIFVQLDSGKLLVSLLFSEPKRFLIVDDFALEWISSETKKIVDKTMEHFYMRSSVTELIRLTEKELLHMLCTAYDNRMLTRYFCLTEKYMSIVCKSIWANS